MSTRRDLLRLFAAQAAFLSVGGCARNGRRTAASGPAPARRPRVLLDTDANNELDDQHAIAYYLAHADIWDLRGITTNRTRNGGDIAEQTAEAERVLRLLGCAGAVPVIAGADGDFPTIRATMGRGDYDGKAAVDFIVAEARAAAPEDPLILLPIGKMTNVALALVADPSIASRVRVVWLGSNWPDPGEYNLDNDTQSASFVVDSAAPLDIAVVRYKKPTGTAAVKISVDEIRRRMPGLGPRVSPVPGRHGGEFETFGDYSVSLFENIGDRERALFDLAAVAVVKNPAWARWTTVPAPALEGLRWVDRPDNPRTIRFATDFDREAILADMFARLAQPVLPAAATARAAAGLQ